MQAPRPFSSKTVSVVAVSGDGGDVHGLQHVLIIVWWCQRSHFLCFHHRVMVLSYGRDDVRTTAFMLFIIVVMVAVFVVMVIHDVSRPMFTKPLSMPLLSGGCSFCSIISRILGSVNFFQSVVLDALLCSRSNAIPCRCPSWYSAVWALEWLSLRVHPMWSYSCGHLSLVALNDCQIHLVHSWSFLRTVPAITTSDSYPLLMARWESFWIVLSITSLSSSQNPLQEYSRCSQHSSVNLDSSILQESLIYPISPPRSRWELFLSVPYASSISFLRA